MVPVCDLYAPRATRHAQRQSVLVPQRGLLPRREARLCALVDEPHEDPECLRRVPVACAQSGADRPLDLLAHDRVIATYRLLLPALSVPPNAVPLGHSPLDRAAITK